jgi:hypothetical protein
MPLLKSMTSSDTYPSTPWPASWVCSLSHLQNQVTVLLLPPSNPLCWGWSSAMIISSTNVHACHHATMSCHFASMWHTLSISTMPRTQQHRAWHAWCTCNSTAACAVMRYEMLDVDACVVYTDGHQECGPRWSVTTVTSGQVTKVL